MTQSRQILPIGRLAWTQRLCSWWSQVALPCQWGGPAWVCVFFCSSVTWLSGGACWSGWCFLASTQPSGPPFLLLQICKDRSVLLTVSGLPVSREMTLFCVWAFCVSWQWWTSGELALPPAIEMYQEGKKPKHLEEVVQSTEMAFEILTVVNIINLNPLTYPACPHFCNEFCVNYTQFWCVQALGKLEIFGVAHNPMNMSIFVLMLSVYLYSA